MSTKTRKKGPSPKRPKSGNARPTSKARGGKAWSQARRKRRMAGLKTAAAVGLGVVALGAIFLLSNSGGSKGTGQAGEYEFVVGNPGPGEKAPPLQLPSSDGGMFDLASESGSSVLLYFQEGIMCQPCWDQLKDIEADFAKFEALGVNKVVTITTDPLDALQQK
ncbi:MAG: redoxin domain-containing protein, partial [Gemmatimonadales bacterium]